MWCDVLWSLFHNESSIEHESSKDTCYFAYITAFAIFFFYLNPPKITQFIHKFPFGEIILLTDLYFYECETELFSNNQVYRIMFGAVHSNQYAIKYGVKKNN